MLAINISRKQEYVSQHFWRDKCRGEQERWLGSSRKPGLSPRRPVSVSRVKPIVAVVAVVYSCYSNSGSVWLCNPDPLFMLPISCLFNSIIVTLLF